MRARAIAFLLIFLAACSVSPGQVERDYEQARHAMWLGDFDDARKTVDHTLLRLSPTSNPEQYWRLRLLGGEIALLKRDFSGANTVVKATLPEGPAFDALRARQRLLEAKAQIDQGRVRAGRGLLAQARQLVGRDKDAALEIDRLDGQALLRLGEWKQGDALLNQVVAEAVAGSDHYHEATALNDIGRGLIARNRYDEALPYFERIATLKDLTDLSISVVASMNAGVCYQRLGQFDRAIALQERALPAQERRGKREYYVQALGELGNVYALRGEPDRALPYYQRGLDRAKEISLTSEATRLANNLASVNVELGRWDEAERQNQEARRLWLLANPKPSVFHVLTSARIAYGRGLRDEAAGQFAAVIDTADAPPFVLWNAHLGLANVAIARKQPAEASREFEAALHIIETKRAELLRTDDKIAYLTNLISYYQDYVSALLAQGQVEQALEVADSSRGQLLAERQSTSSPGRVKAAAFKRVARDADVVLLSYWLAPDKSYLWVIAPNTLRMLTLPPAREVESLVRQHQAVIANAMGDPLATANSAGDRLYQTLVAPASPWMNGHVRVIIVPDGALHEINFETLTVPGPRHHYWIDDVQIEIAPSLATLTASAEPAAGGDRRLLLVGNADPHEPDFPSLRHAGTEMTRVAAHFPAASVTTLSGERASPAGYADAHPDRFAYVHFTAHAAANRDSPLDSIVVLSGPGDRFKLYARDVAALPLQADLVTISACRSAGDHAYAGDGLVGFSWAFLKAGARHVVAGLWDVDDSSTPALMDRLYEGIADGMTPGQALRDAKRTLIAQGGASASPYRWAALELFTASLETAPHGTAARSTPGRDLHQISRASLPGAR